MKLPALLQARWSGASRREQQLVQGALALLMLALLWWGGLAPALSTLRSADRQHRLLGAELQQMQRLQLEARALQSQPRLAFDGKRHRPR